MLMAEQMTRYVSRRVINSEKRVVIVIRVLAISVTCVSI